MAHWSEFLQMIVTGTPAEVRRAVAGYATTGWLIAPGQTIRSCVDGKPWVESTLYHPQRPLDTQQKSEGYQYINPYPAELIVDEQAGQVNVRYHRVTWPKQASSEVVCVCGWKSSDHPGEVHDDTDYHHRVVLPMIAAINDLMARVKALEGKP
jgi:hypothetical protein